MATVAAFGFAMYLGIEFIGLNLAAPFLMIGKLPLIQIPFTDRFNDFSFAAIGIDDTFVMLSAWRKTTVKLPVPERMALMMSEAAVSITITSLTDFVSFMIGIINIFPSVQIFCTYSALAVLFIFVWHITFLAGWVAVLGYCEEKNLHSVFGYKVLPLSMAVKGKRNPNEFSSSNLSTSIAKSTQKCDVILLERSRNIEKIVAMRVAIAQLLT